MNIYCTLFDSWYLSKGLAMYESLKEHSSAFHLYIYAFDDLSRDILNMLQISDVTVVSLEEFETDELRRLKSERSKAEYCWTCTPSIISHTFQRYGVSECTYIDSDLYFYSDPSALIDEMYRNGKQVLISEHRYSLLPRFYEEKRSGRFCVQFMTFTAVQSSQDVLDVWRRQCIDWCYARHEDGKFGDQKYLDEWPSIYTNVHILENQGGGIAPWNLLRYSFRRDGNRITGKVVKDGSEFTVVFYHFQYVKLMNDGSFDIGWYMINSTVRKLFYQPYLDRIRHIETNLRKADKQYHPGISVLSYTGLKGLPKGLLKKIFRYNILKFKS